jgi:hypothetical protein
MKCQNVLICLGIMIFNGFVLLLNAVTVTDPELAALSEYMLTNDENNCASLITINAQGTTCFSCNKDAAPAP